MMKEMVRLFSLRQQNFDSLFTFFFNSLFIFIEHWFEFLCFGNNSHDRSSLLVLFSPSTATSEVKSVFCTFCVWKWGSGGVADRSSQRWLLNVSAWLEVKKHITNVKGKKMDYLFFLGEFYP